MTTPATSTAGLHYVGVGDGPVCLIAHGGPGLHHGLYRSLDPLARDRRLLFWDHRGHGRSAPLPLTGASMKLFADDAIALADELGLGRFALFGHSFGGWVAQEIALRYPDRVEALVLAATTPGQLGTTESPDDEQGPPPPPRVEELLSLTPASNAELIAMYTELAPYFFRGGEPAMLVEALDPSLVSAGSMAQVFAALGAWSSVDRLGTISCPTLLIAGRHDVFTSVPQLERIAKRVPTAELVVFEHTGHFMWADDPDGFFALLDTWLPSSRG